MNWYLLFSSIFINHSITFCLFFYWLIFNGFIRPELILPKITLLILPISFLAELINLTVGLFWKFSLRSLRVKKQLLSSLIPSRCKTCLFFTIPFPFLVIFSLIFLFALLPFLLASFHCILVK